ncbi:hypothetical protein B0H14DRAFT_2570795 [Mycena olivaceomarginata]|nr:hypothetical protein B0H14DRAFT_2570795 [Mycena olivaceomarginata]
MPLEIIKPKAITGLDDLDMDKRNYVRWSETALDAFLFAGVREYVLGEIQKPDETDSDYPIWVVSANRIWVDLKKRHRQKVSTQTSLLDDLLGMRIERGMDMVTGAAKIRDLAKQVFDVGPLDADKLALAVLLRSLAPELKSIREKYEDDDLADVTDIVKSLEKEKLRWEEENKQIMAMERANAARAAKAPVGKPSNTRGLCGTCNGPHRTDECWGKGGAMEGRRDEVLERRAARRKEKEKPSSTSSSASAPAKPSAKPRFAMKDGKGNTVYFTMADDQAETTTGPTPSATAAVARVPISDANETITSSAELEKIYATHHSRRDSGSSGYSYAAYTHPDVDSVTDSERAALGTAKRTVEPFVADTGATVPITPVREDFFTFENIAPFPIYGIAGNSITATGKGDVHIEQNDGGLLIIKNTLYVPDAEMRLMSVGCMNDCRLLLPLHSQYSCHI